MICEDSKETIIDFIKYLETNCKKYEFHNGGWFYEKPIYDFILFYEKEKIILEYKNVIERKKLINKDENFDNISIEEIRNKKKENI